MKKIILFDFDGTIADTLEPALEIVNAYLKKEGYDQTTGEELKELRNMNPLQIISHFKYPIWKMPSLVKKVRDDLYEETDKIKIFPGIKKLIKNLKTAGFRLAILTSNLEKTVDKFLENNKLKVFDYIKGEPNILEKSKLINSFLKENKLRRGEVIYIGDEVRDIEACKNEGIQIISVSWGFNDPASLKKMKPNFIVRKPAEIFNLLKEI